MSTISKSPETNRRSLMNPNPILNRLGKIKDRVESDGATYAGIATKTTFFLIMTLAGIVLQLVLSGIIGVKPGQEGIHFQVYEKFNVSLSVTEAVVVGLMLVVGLISELVGVFAQRTVPVTGTIYSITQGYVISFLVFKVLGESGYAYLGLEALLLTVAVVAVMSWLYSSGTIKPDKKYHTVLMSLLLGSVGFAVISGLGMLIPATRPFVQDMMKHAWLTIALDVIGLIIASLFLISDFSMIDRCVQEGYPKEYEWYSAFGLVFTVLWIYLKILDLLMQIVGKKDN